MDTLKASDKRNHFDKTRREMAEKFELRRRLYKALSRDTQLPADIREKSKTKLADLPRNSSLTRVLNRCVFTGRTRGVYQMFRMSRIAFREMARKGILPGVKKASW